MKLRYFYKINHLKQPIPASNIRRKSKPPGHQWKEMFNFCCDPLEIDCTCGPRFFVQIDPKGNPIDHTIIKRDDKPKPEQGIKYAELNWKNICCSPISWTLAILGDAEGALTISLNDVEIAAGTTDAYNGTYIPKDGDLIQISLVNSCEGEQENILQVISTDSKGNNETIIDLTETEDIEDSFVYEAGKTYVITSSINCTIEEEE